MQKKEEEIPVLKLEKVSKVYGTGDIEVLAVDNVDFTANAGEVVLIMGPSGSGKTTLITLAGTLLKPTQGSVYIDGENVVNLSEKEKVKIRLQKLGFVFQDFNLLANLTALENIVIPLILAGVNKDLAFKKARGLVEQFGLNERANFIPSKLSGGEKQRVSIARALANDPKLILADEPTANLDSQHGRELMRLLKKVAKNMGKTVVVVSHDQRLAEIADRVLWLEDGRFKDPSGMSLDPNCGTRVTERSSTQKLFYRGKKYLFCSKECKEEFREKNNIPESYF